MERAENLELGVLAMGNDDTARRLWPTDPERVGGYEILGRLGAGGQGVVYQGQAPGGGLVAIKVLSGMQERATLARFAREVEHAKRVARFCTAQVLAADVTARPPYIVSEYVPGQTLRNLVRAEGPLPPADLDRLAIGTLAGLVAIGEAGVIHRDFKPANVIMAPGGPRVIDFGIARSVDTITFEAGAGTLSYMAPEQLDESDSVGQPCDMWAWAATMVFAATGNPPDRQRLGVPIGRLDEPLRSLVAQALRPEPAARPTAMTALSMLIGRKDMPSTGELLRTSQAFAAPPVLQRPPPPYAPPRYATIPGGRSRLSGAALASVITACVVAVAAVAVGVAVLANRGGPEPAPPTHSPRATLPPVADADIAGSHTLNRTQVSCVNVNDCQTTYDNDPLSIVVTDCAAGRCHVTEANGAWPDMSPLAFDGAEWRSTGACDQNPCAYNCGGVARPTGLSLTLKVLTARLVNGAWTAESFGGTFMTYTTTTVPNCTGNAGRTWNLSG